MKGNYPSIFVQTDNSYAALFADPYSQKYQIYLSATLKNYPTLTTFTYFDPCDPDVETCDPVMLQRQED